VDYSRGTGSAVTAQARGKGHVNARVRYNCRVKRSRILGIVLIGVLCLAAIGVIVYWEGSQTNPANPFVDKILGLPQEGWQLGDVTAKRYAPDKSGKYSYSFTKGKDDLFISFELHKDEGLHTSIMLISGDLLNGTMAALEMSDVPLSQKLPGKPGAILLAAQDIAKGALTAKTWPWRLRGAKQTISDVAQAKIRVLYSADNILDNVETMDYDNEEVVSVPLFGHFWKNRSIISMYKSGVIDLNPSGNTVFAKDATEAKRIWEEAGERFRRESLLGDIFPQIPKERILRLRDAYGLWSTGKYRMLPKMEKDALSEHAYPWNKLGKPAEIGERAEVMIDRISPVTINGVRIAPEEGKDPYYLQLDYAGKSFEWRPHGNDSLRTPSGSENTTAAIIPYRVDYPIRKMKCSDPQAEADIQVMQSFAEKLLAAKAEEWPDAEWSRRMRSDMEKLREGRYILSYRRDAFMGIGAMEVFEGDNGYLRLTADTTYPGGKSKSQLELRVDTAGFNVYDPVNECLLEVGGSGAKLTQKPEDIAAGKKFNIAGAKALLAYAQLVKDKLTPDLAGALAKPAKFFTSGQIPAPVSGDVVPPEWSHTYRAEQMAN
jgi:hypothetical protein